MLLKSYPEDENSPSDKRLFLTHDEAILRKTLIGDITYTLTILLTKGEYLFGNIVIEFDLLKVHPSLFLDFDRASIYSLEINKLKLNPTDVYKNSRISIPLELQILGHNRIIVYYSCEYQNMQTGLRKNENAGKYYFYSQFEPWGANAVFPCFDQPDLKAYFQLISISPNEWEVISNEFVETVTFTKTNGIQCYLEKYCIDPKILPEPNATVRIFRKTQNVMSTYLFAIIAGDFIQLECKDSKIPIRVYAKSVYKTGFEKFWEEFFEITKQGLEFYAKFLNVPYSFPKYDQIFVPNFNEVAMENSGCVTLSEDLIENNSPHLHYLLLHEMAHHWFGNLVTMKWWDDLWLNESFATHFGRFVQSNLMICCNYGKPWATLAHKKDNLANQNTHALVNPLENMESAESIFDTICYEKGAAILRQLSYMIGEENFKEFITQYLQKYKWKNTTNLDFIEMLTETINKNKISFDIKLWSNLWIYKGGMANYLKPEIIITDGKISKFCVLQANDSHDETYRIHCISIMLENTDTSWTILKNIKINPECSTEISEAIGLPAPKSLLLNADDFAFCITILDNDSLEYFEKITTNNDWRHLHDYFVINRIQHAILETHKRMKK